MEVRRFLRKPPVTVTRERPLTEAAELMGRHGVGALVVTTGKRVVGIVTDRDIVVRSLARGNVFDDRVKDVMTSDVATVEASAEAGEAIALLRARGVRRLPVVEDGALVGMVTVDDLLVYLVSLLDALATPVLDELLEDGEPE